MLCPNAATLCPRRATIIVELEELQDEELSLISRISEIVLRRGEIYAMLANAGDAPTSRNAKMTLVIKAVNGQ